MKKILILLVVFSSVFANDKTLSRSCLKNNPIVVDETDTNLIEMYDGYCDKKNADIKYSYLARAAQRFQQLGKNFKALQVINELESLNLRGNTITDVKFLASANLANQALDQMRTVESRYLTSEVTYPIAQKLSENIDLTKSNIILKMESPVKSVERNVVKPKSQTSVTRTLKRNVNKSSMTPKPRVAPSAKPVSSSTGSGNPFDFTKK